MTKKKNKKIKYTVINSETDEILLEEETKKAFIEWLHKMIDDLSDEDHLSLVKEFYGKKADTLDLHISVIKHVNDIAIEQRVKKIIKKPLTISGITYIIKGE